MAKPFEKKTYFAMTLDPVHVGTGGYRLGRVDNTITREPGTNLPKIPGSSVAGVTRSYTAMAIQSENPLKMKYQREKAIDKIKSDGTKEPVITYESCAGKGADDGEGHCGQPNCEVCVSFGFSKGKSGSSFQGLAQFYDARILLFPVHSMIGPVWITSPSILREFGENVEVNEKKFKAINSDYSKKLNFGWLMLENDSPSKVTVAPSFFNRCDASNEIKGRSFLISDRLFSRVVNDNLEVRTSVAIDPATGAAEDGALYTYEAIPRATVMWFDVIYNQPEYFRIKENGIDKPIEHGESPGNGWNWINKNVEKGLAYLEYLGVGGMNTRGMGRLRVLNMGGQNNGNT